MLVGLSFPEEWLCGNEEDVIEEEIEYEYEEQFVPLEVLPGEGSDRRNEMMYYMLKWCNNNCELVI